MISWIHSFFFARAGQLFLPAIVLASLYFTSVSVSVTHAADLYTTDDYLRGLDDEVSDPAYLVKAREELRETEDRERNQRSTAEIRQALISRYNFETLIRTKYPSSHVVYSKLPTSSRILIYDEFKKTKKLSIAKRMIIENFESQ